MNTNKTIIAPSILSADFSDIASAVKQIETAGADWVHLDVMDGQFVPPITFGEKMVSDIRKITKLPLDVHLMIKKPENKIDDFIKAGSDYITVHYEATCHLHRVLTTIREGGAKPGVSIIPSTAVELIYPILELCSQVLIMSVNPGYGGQKMITSSLDKVRKLTTFRRENNLNFIIAIDGGVNMQNAIEIQESGVDAFVAGSAFFNSKDPAVLVNRLKGAE